MGRKKMYLEYTSQAKIDLNTNLKTVNSNLRQVTITGSQELH